jgi:hypothetical protein
MIYREHIRQRFARSFVRDALDCQHEFASFDSAKVSTMQARQREAARGVVSGWPDTGLFVVGFPPIWCEWKAPGNKPSARQEAVGDRLMGLGHWWSWCASVVTYCAWLRSIGVPLRPNAELLAMHADAKADAAIAKAETRKPRAYAAPAKKPTAARTRKLNAMRAAGLL